MSSSSEIKMKKKGMPRRRKEGKGSNGGKAQSPVQEEGDGTGFIEEMKEKVQRGELFEADIRYNAADRSEAFCSIDGLRRDLLIRGSKYQNKSVHGDTVIVEILDEKDWMPKFKTSRSSTQKDGERKNDASHVLASPSLFHSRSGGEVDVSWSDHDEEKSDEDEGRSMMEHVIQVLKSKINISKNKEAPVGVNSVKIMAKKVEEVQSLLDTSKKGWVATGKVVAIVKPSFRRQCVIGTIRQGDKPWVFVPKDSRMPPGKVLNDKQVTSWLHKEGMKSLENCYFLAQIKDWPRTSLFADMYVTKLLGATGELSNEVQAILLGEHVDYDENFNESVMKCLPESPWKIPDEELSSRRDLRKSRVFSIDPESARDLDDALSIRNLENGNYEVGVHIADVSFFVKTGTPLDMAAQYRSTSVYLIDRVIPMLPRRLCEDLCSLNPGTDRLCMSIIWEMDEGGKILNTWIGRTVIHSCAKLSYGDAQKVIEAFEASNSKKVETQAPPHLQFFGNVNWSLISEDIIKLHLLAKSMRLRRFENGSLKLNNTKIKIEISPEGMPEDFHEYESVASNYLIEEFMLAANITAATTISSVFPESSLLRMHPSPDMEKLSALSEMLETLFPAGPTFDISSSGSIEKSLHELEECVEDLRLYEVIVFLCTKPMQNALYFNTGSLQEEEWGHYALATPKYTHFTSPIRRYPDIVVHRLLLQCCGLSMEKVIPEGVTLNHIADHANNRKMGAKICQDRCLRLYLAKVLTQKPCVMEAVVCGLGGSRFFDVYLPRLGIDLRLFTASAFHGMGKDGVKSSWQPEKRVLIIKLAKEPRKSSGVDIPNIGFAKNPNKLEKCGFPITLRLFTMIPLLVFARNVQNIEAIIWADTRL